METEYLNETIGMLLLMIDSMMLDDVFLLGKTKSIDSLLTSAKNVAYHMFLNNEIAIFPRVRARLNVREMSLFFMVPKFKIQNIKIVVLRTKIGLSLLCLVRVVCVVARVQVQTQPAS